MSTVSPQLAVPGVRSDILHSSSSDRWCLVTLEAVVKWYIPFRGHEQAKELCWGRGVEQEKESVGKQKVDALLWETSMGTLLSQRSEAYCEWRGDVKLRKAFHWGVCLLRTPDPPAFTVCVVSIKERSDREKKNKTKPNYKPSWSKEKAHKHKCDVSSWAPRCMKNKLLKAPARGNPSLLLQEEELGVCNLP